MPGPNTVEQTRAPLPARLLNRCGTALERIGIGARIPSAGQFIETAKRRCDLDDFGDGEFFEALSRLLDACQREAGLNVIGKMAVRSDVVRILCNRLLLERDRQLYPEIVQQQIRQPLFIVGYPAT